MLLQVVTLPGMKARPYIRVMLLLLLFHSGQRGWYGPGLSDYELRPCIYPYGGFPN